jgi:HEAT repeat protein
MTAKLPHSTAIAVGISTWIAAETQGANPLDDLIARIKSNDETVRGPAWQGAGPLGAPAVKPLAALMADGSFETARCAKRALYIIVRHAGRPGAENEAKAVASELILLLSGATAPVQREILWMLSEIGAEESVAPMVALLANTEVRDDARCALMRLPFPQAAAALKAAFSNAPEEFKFALAESLRQLGHPVTGYPSQKLVPNRKTTLGL